MAGIVERPKQCAASGNGAPMSSVFIISHPEVIVDPAKPVPRWSLSAKGIARMRHFVASDALSDVSAVWSSTEAKAIEAAGLLCARFGVALGVHEGLGENDRSATGFVPPTEFEQLADQFFAQPEVSTRGWERAVDAQTRICAAVDTILAQHKAGDLAIICHGAVGTLLMCHYLGEPISRIKDQPFQGHFWAFARETREVLHPWQPIAPRELNA